MSVWVLWYWALPVAYEYQAVLIALVRKARKDHGKGQSANPSPSKHDNCVYAIISFQRLSAVCFLCQQNKLKIENKF